MLWVARIGGVLCLCVSCWLLVANWDTVVNPEIRRQKCEIVQPGISLGQTEMILGEKGVRVPMGGHGNFDTGFPEKYRWSDSFVVLDVEFVQGISTSANLFIRESPNYVWLWLQRFVIATLAIAGCFLIVRRK